MDNTSPTNADIKKLFQGCFVVVVIIFILLYLFYIFATTLVFINSGWLYIFNNKGSGTRLTFFQSQNINLDLPLMGKMYNHPPEDPWSKVPAYTIRKIEVVNDINSSYFIYKSTEDSSHGEDDWLETFASHDNTNFQKNWQLEDRSVPNYVFKNSFLYLAGCAVTAKIDLTKGTYVWKHEYKWDDPCIIKVDPQGSKVSFTDINGKVTLMDDGTGKIEQPITPLDTPLPSSTSQTSPAQPS